MNASGTAAMAASRARIFVMPAYQVVIDVPAT
jgi:hypothetical protein